MTVNDLMIILKTLPGDVDIKVPFRNETNGDVGVYIASGGPTVEVIISAKNDIDWRDEYLDNDVSLTKIEKIKDLA